MDDEEDTVAPKKSHTKNTADQCWQRTDDRKDRQEDEGQTLPPLAVCQKTGRWGNEET